jgi:DNA-binding IclR family transcriptional regulator
MKENDNDKVAADRSVAAAERSLLILEAFLGDAGPRSLVELEERTGLFKSVILRYMISFEGRGFVRKDERGQYWLGPKAFQLGRAFENNFDMSSTMQPVLNRLMQATSESASVYVKDGDWRVCMLRAEPNRAVRVATLVGTRLPIDGTATGMVLSRYHGKTWMDIGQLSQKLVAASAGVGDPLLASMSAPLFGPGEVCIGALTLSGVNGHFDIKSARFRELLFNEAVSASVVLGASVPASAP